MKLNGARKDLRYGDERLARAVADGDDAAFEVLFQRHQPAILAFCRHMLGRPHDAQDATQHTFLTAYRVLRAGDAPVALRSWLFAVARNRCISMLRVRREQAGGDRLLEVTTDGLAGHVQDRADLRALLDDVTELPDDQRAALLLAQVGDLSHQEIAGVIGVRREKVRALVFQARRALLAAREARDMPCRAIQEELAGARGAALRRAHLRRHLHVCPSCREFRDGLRHQHDALALLLPVAPWVLRDSILGAGANAAAAGGNAAAVGANAAATGATSAGGTSAGATAAGATSAAGTAAGAGAAGATAIIKVTALKVAIGVVAAGGIAAGGTVADLPRGSDSEPIAALQAPLAAEAGPFSAAGAARSDATGRWSTAIRPGLTGARGTDRALGATAGSDRGGAAKGAGGPKPRPDGGPNPPDGAPNQRPDRGPNSRPRGGPKPRPPAWREQRASHPHGAPPGQTKKATHGASERANRPGADHGSPQRGRPATPPRHGPKRTHPAAPKGHGTDGPRPQAHGRPANGSGTNRSRPASTGNGSNGAGAAGNGRPRPAGTANGSNGSAATGNGHGAKSPAAPTQEAASEPHPGPAPGGPPAGAGGAGGSRR